jgi:L-seryl-tRNA(Ser) seleniumtransferase
MSARSNPLRSLPAVETLLRHPALERARHDVPRVILLEAVRAELESERDRIRREKSAAASAQVLAERAAKRAGIENRPELVRVLNATGIVLHTNLGRAPLSIAALHALTEVSAGYSSLEFDLERGRRGARGVGVERWLTRLTGAEAAMVVNNGAAAVLLVLAALASGRRVVVSRGELIEIGGSFRIPEILNRSGAELVEVGTTNRTHLRDYERALEKRGDVAAILRVHPSNFRVSGFTTRPELQELARLARRRRVALIEDLGSGALVEMSEFGLEHEPTVRESLNAGCDVVTFSGDKLLGGTQAGLILGRKRWVERARRDPLARALRVDKLTLAALEATLPAYSDPERARREIPALVMLSATQEMLERRAHRLGREITERIPEMRAAVESGLGEVGGGALPLQRLPTRVVSLEAPGVSADRLEALARRGTPPVIGYIRGDRLKLDVRTLTDDEAVEAAVSLAGAWTEKD